jgi:uncharacterized oligopeptide transporter (OPT) family protein
MGIRYGVSMLLGSILNYFFLVPWMIRDGVILKDAAGHYGFGQIIVWSLWGGVACMTTSSLASFLSDPKTLRESFRFFKGGSGKKDVLADIELPVRLSFIGVPIAGLALVVLGYLWFDIHPLLSLLSIPLVFVFALIAVTATGLTSLTPTGALANLTQLLFGALAPRNITTNILAGGITAEVSANASSLLMDIKPGYMLGAKPRQQAVGHLLGAFSGLALSVPVWYYVFIQGDVSRYGSDRVPAPAALQWKGVAELLMGGIENLHPTMRAAVVIGALVGLAVEISKKLTKDRFPLSAMGLGLSFVLSFHDVWAMFLGSVLFWALQRKTKRWEAKRAGGPAAEGTPRELPSPAPRKPWFAIAAENTETICGGVIAGGALMGILVNVLDVLVFPRLGMEAQQARAVGAVIRKAVEALPH